MADSKYKGWIAKNDLTYHLVSQKNKLKKGQEISDFELQNMTDYTIECWFCAPDSKEGKAIKAVKELDEEKEVKKTEKKDK